MKNKISNIVFFSLEMFGLLVLLTLSIAKIKTQEIKKIKPDVKIIMLTSHKEKEKVLDSLSSGANAYCLKNIQYITCYFFIKEYTTIINCVYYFQ